MRRIGATGLFVGIMLAMSGRASAQVWTPPPEAQRCPSKWGANDERGSGNHMKPATVLRALSLVKTGEVIELAFPLRPDMPFPGGRMYNLTTKRTALERYDHEFGFRVHVRSALKCGATEDEILEALEVVGMQKIHSLTSMLPVLVEEVEKFRKDKRSMMRLITGVMLLAIAVLMYMGII